MSACPSVASQSKGSGHASSSAERQKVHGPVGSPQPDFIASRTAGLESGSQ